jgi:LmbE family N-acetylglucosaminyl deacetylase
MRLFDPDPSIRWLFCMTHPDDEISICAWINHCVMAGAPVYMSWTHSDPVREREARASAALLGVPQDHLFFFGATDGSICDEIEALLPKFEELMLKVLPDRVCCGAFEQGHLDHDATNLLVNRSFRGPILEVPFYHTYLTRLQTINRFSDPRGEEVRELDLDEQRFKVQFARRYPSQNIWSVLLWYEIWQFVRFRPMELPRTERMRLQGRTDFCQPNHPERIAAAVRAHPRWARWQRAVERLDAIPAVAPRSLAAVGG